MLEIYIKFDSAYQGESTYTCRPHGFCGSRSIRLSFRSEAPEYILRSISDASRYVPEYLNAVGILRSTEHYYDKSLRQGEATPEVLAAFNAYIDTRYQDEIRDILKFRRIDRPDTTEDEVRGLLPAPVPAVAGYYAGPEDGWVKLP